jgi:hypothetical protein
MNFTSKIKVGILIIAVAAIAAWGSHAGFAPMVAQQHSISVEEPYRLNSLVWFIPAPSFQQARSDYYQPVTAWYKNKHWWKKNAPIVGGAGGGALVGGLLGGGKGALIGGAVGGGGGYLYKRHHSHHSRYPH